MNGLREILLVAVLMSLICLLPPAVLCHAQDRVTLNADFTDYDRKTWTYTARGNVKIQWGTATISTDAVTYNEETGDAVADRDLVYEDERVSIKAGRAELNLEMKTGKLFNAEILSKKDNFRIAGEEIEKEGEGEYTLKNAIFTTCDGPVPAWCFKGSDVDAVVGDRVKARGATFRILDVPVLYTPYVSLSLDKERKTGFLSPGVGYVKSKGFHLEQPFFWAISGNRDVMLLLDLYTDRGIGQGLEYRFVEPDGAKGDLFVYHIRDDDFKKDFWGLRGFYDRERDSRYTAYLRLSYVNSRDFYDEYVPYIMNRGDKFADNEAYLNVTTERYLESVGEASMRLRNSRLFVTAQYLVDLKEGVDKATVLQQLPQIGYFINPQRVGPLVFSLSSTLSNFWRDEGVRGQRLDIYPKLSYSFGSDIVVAQSLGLRETAYLLSGSDEYGDTAHRESLDYSIVAQTRLSKRYPTLTHIVEPSLSYTFIPDTNSDLPLFDSTELYLKTSTIELALLNRFLDSGGEFLTFKIAQAYDSYLGDRPFLPLKFDVALRRPLTFRGQVFYDFNTGKPESINSDLSLGPFNGLALTVGERYNRPRDILFFRIGGLYPFTKELSAEGDFWYDAKGDGLTNFIAKLKYQKQCWGMTLIFTKKEGDYSINALFDLLGLGQVKI